MVRTVLYLIVSIFVIALLRGIIGLITKGVAGLFEPDGGGAASGRPRQAGKTGMGGELMKDPVCGTYVSPAAALTKSAGGHTHYFCSEACRDRFTG